MALYHYLGKRTTTGSTWTSSTGEAKATNGDVTNGGSDAGTGDTSTSVEWNSEATETEAITTSPAGETPAASASGSASQQNKLRDGAVAGIAIGCLVAGLIVGTILGWLLRRAKSRSRHRRRRYGSEEKTKMLNQPKDEGLVALEPLSKKIELEHVVLQSRPDSDIVEDLKRLEVIIEQHVGALYRSGPVDVKVVRLAHALTALGTSKSSSGFDAETVAGWCLQTNTRRGALQHVISHVLFRSIDWNSPGPLTLLPKPAVGFLNSIRPVEQYRDNFDVMSFAWTRWRTLSALFLHPAPHERTPLELSEPDVQDQAEAVAKALDSVLHYFVSPDQESRRKQLDHLHVMIIDAAKLGYVLFSHTSDWRFIYKDESGKGGAVVCVGLEKLSGRDGRRLGSPQRIAEPRLLS
ncbi:hypothetical protein LCI18_009415 [Fusarium solani-melongenae]|uniref:Uncharacterized protein n=1 Tax=Fusarium solani subsp. cucurbitae TaxID=2747967 RepID=A0ACD3ZB72_FUSSC|nr:hypothetical protein LCI18_009415 [Fusarium solani-melongenae]